MPTARVSIKNLDRIRPFGPVTARLVASPEAGEAQESLTSGIAFSGRGSSAASPGCRGGLQQDLATRCSRGFANLAQGEQLGHGQHDGGGLQPDEAVAHGHLLGGEGVEQARGEPIRSTVAHRAGEALDPVAVEYAPPATGVA